MIFFERESTTCSSVAPTYAYAWNEGVTNGAGVHIVGALYTGKMYYADGSADCAESVGDVNRYYEDGAIVPATTFAPAIPMIDP